MFTQRLETIMTPFKSRLLSAIGASAMILSVPLVSMASWEEPDYSDVTYACKHISAELAQLLAIEKVHASDVKVVYIEDILTDAELAQVKSTLDKLSVEILTLRDSLNEVEVLKGRG